MNSKNTVQTHGGAPVVETTPINQLRRAVLSNFLWQNEYYESGASIATRIKTLVAECQTEQVCELAIEAREKMNLRSVPLLLVRELARKKDVGQVLGRTITQVIQRPDELHKLLELYWEDGKDQALSKQMKLGVAGAFRKFGTYAFGKYRKGDSVALRDAMFMVHPKPKTSSRHLTKAERKEGVDVSTLTRDELLYKQIADDTLPTPDTWEVALSGGADKKETFERLLEEGNLGYMALLRNLRNMAQTGVKKSLVTDAIIARKGADKVLPFRFYTAANAAPEYQEWLDTAFVANLQTLPKLPGRTIFVVDVSGSMSSGLSGNTQVSRGIAASALAAIAREICEDSVVYATAGSDRARTHATKKVPESRGLVLAKDIWAMMTPLGGGGIFLKQVMDFIAKEELQGADRTIVITDEQDCGQGEDRPENAVVVSPRNYIMNVGSYKNGIDYGKWTKINGFSESVLQYILETEASDQRNGV